VVHAIPGRLRLRLERADLSDDFVAALERLLLSMPGVQEVRIALQTGSVVVRFDQRQLDLERLLAQARASRLLELVRADRPQDQVKTVPTSLTAARVQRAFHEVDVRLSELSHGRWDLRSVVPATFGLLALRQIVTNFGDLAGIPWYALAWYAFDSFWKLNDQARSGQQPPAPPAEPAAPSPDEE
jgi:heavy-metal-associated domain-containing protein